MAAGKRRPASVADIDRQIEALVLECLQVLAADLGLLLELGEIEPLAQAGFSQAIADLEHGLARL